MKAWLAVLTAIGLLALVLGGWPSRQTPPERAPNLDLEHLLDPDASGFPVLDETWSLNLPSDHGAHPATRGELWNLALWLRDAQDRDHWLQFSLGRLALSARSPERPSAWAAHQLYRGHWLLLSSGETTPRATERLGRAALGMAGASTDPPRVWLNDWSLEGDSDPNRLRLVARQGTTGLDLTLSSDKPALRGEQLDLFARNPGEPGPRAYLLTRLRATGTLTLDGQPLRVRGSAWLEHAWSGIGDAGTALGLNRFAIQLADGRDLICLELQRQDGGGRPIPGCALILADGGIQSFRRRDLELNPLGHWSSPRTGRAYPTDWRLAIPLLDLELGIEATIEDQETDLSIPTWNGVVRVQGRQGERRLAGIGRVELSPRAASQGSNREAKP